jgi:ATP-dependent helicase/nuclease subunit B
LIAQAAWTGSGPLDLSHRLILVPTRQSGRRLREALAEAAAAHDQAVFAPQVMVPESLPAAVAQLPAVATRHQILVAWMRVLLAAHPAAYRAVFPIDPPQRDAAWARRLAERLARVQNELAAGGLRMRDVLAAPQMPEAARWQELAQLEAEFDRVLAEQGVNSAVVASQAGLATAALPTGIESVVLAGCPDPNPAAIRYLEKLHLTAPIEVLVYGADDLVMADAFDAWGRPQPDTWGERALALPDFESQVRLAADPAQQAKVIAAHVRSAPDPEEWLALAMVDPEVTPPLTRELEEAGKTVFLPEGESWRQGTLFGLLQALSALVDGTDIRAVGNLLRCPDVMATLASQTAGEIAPETLLRHWDRVLENSLATDLAGALDHAGIYPHLRRALLVVQDWVDALQGDAFATVALSLPAEIMSHQTIASDSVVAEGARRWGEVVSRINEALALFPDLPAKEQWQLALDGFAEGTRFGHRPAGAIELGGWLEVLWADAPRLIIAGANDGHLPQAVSGDAFLPEALREQLNLKTNNQRLAVDAYLLAAAIGARPGADDVLILVGKAAASGDPLRPSRTLMTGAQETLPQRVQHLFQPLPSAEENRPWRRAWKLRPRKVKLKPSISVTGLRDWLDCPFRFYLKRGLKMQELELPKTELNAMDFGTLVHRVLEEMGRASALRDTMDVALLRDGMLADLERRIREAYGEAPALPLFIQFESARQRLRQVAEVEIMQRQLGWKTERVEWSFEVPLEGLTITGKIDRIDRHEDGRVRVIDYKTSDRAVDPLSVHLATLRADDVSRPDWLKVMHGGKERRWTDLQLPLYRLALAAEFGRDLTCAYFNLPKAIGETGLARWDDPDDQLQASAEACARGVAAAIGNEEFWPPVDQLSRYDAGWHALFHHGITASVDENWIQQEVGNA